VKCTDCAVWQYKFAVASYQSPVSASMRFASPRGVIL